MAALDNQLLQVIQSLTETVKSLESRTEAFESTPANIAPGSAMASTSFPTALSNTSLRSFPLLLDPLLHVLGFTFILAPFQIVIQLG